MNIDIRTVIFLTVIIFILCTIFMMQLWKLNRSRFAGLNYLVIDFSMQTTAVTLIALRGTIPDFISIVLSNFLIISGCIAAYMGLLLFVDKKSQQIQNYIFLALFLFSQIFFTFVHPSLEYRILNLSIGLIFVCFQCCWLMFYRTGKSMRPLTFWVGIAFGGYCAISVLRIIEFIFSSDNNADYFHSGLFQALILTSFLLVFIMLTYSFIIMVNNRLLLEIVVQEEKFSKAFHSAPYAITLSRFSDGTMLDANEKFFSITGYNRSDVTGKKTLDLNIFLNEKDRAIVTDILSKDGKAVDIELGFRTKKGDVLTGLLSSEILSINGEKIIMSSVSDITTRKLAENKIKDLLREKEIILKEVHHRIKNNMYTISSLLGIQASSVKEPSAVSALEDAGSRLQSMMVLYDKLYLSENNTDVRTQQYLPALIDQIIFNFPFRKSITVKKQIDDFILDAKSLSSLGIIINELLTNIMKYAFKEKSDGLIIVSASLKDNVVSIIIQDDGVGIPETVDFTNSSGFGFTLVDMLTKQLHGTIRLERGKGTKFILEFVK